jgi:chitodextrinase
MMKNKNSNDLKLLTVFLLYIGISIINSQVIHSQAVNHKWFTDNTTTVTNQSLKQISYLETIPPDRRIIWNPGIPGGIPDYPMAINVKNSPYNAIGDGIADDLNAIQSAIDACPKGSAVFLPAGKYRITNQLRITKGIVLRGESPTNTKIMLDSKETNFISAGSWMPDKAIDIISGYEKGSNTIVVADATTISAGDYITLYQDNESGLVFSEESGGGICTWCGVEACTWCGDEPNNGNHTMSQMVKVISKTGNSLTLSRPLYYTFKAENDPEIQKQISMTSGVGIEDISLEKLKDGSAKCNMYFEALSYSWVKNVRSYNCVAAHIRMVYCYSCEIRDNFLYDAHTHQGSRSYGLDMLAVNSDHLIENNIILRCAPAICFEGGGSGNVFSYNFTGESWYDFDGGDWLHGNIAIHGAHPFMNLFEGNILDKVQIDNIHGSSSHNTYFRNHITRHRDLPKVGTEAIVAFDVYKHSYFNNFIGNILGKPGDVGSDECVHCDDNRVNWKMGCLTGGGDYGLPADSNVAATAMRHGNFDYITNSVKWDSAIADHNLPYSYYLTAKPSFFGALAWPPIGSDLTEKTGTIPAKIRFENMLAGDAEPPSTPANFKITNLTSKTITLTWDGSEENVAFDKYKIYKNGVLAFSTTRVQSWRDTEVLPESTYTYTIKACDRKGNESLPVSIQTKTLPLQYYTLKVVNGTGSGVYAEGTQLTIFADAPEAGSSFYQWVGDMENLNSAWRTDPQVTVLGNMEVIAIYKKAGDTQPPSAPTLYLQDVKSTSIKLRWGWGANGQDYEKDVIYFSLYKNGTSIGGWIQKKTYEDTDLTPDTTYVYTIYAADASNNISPYSLPLEVRTLSSIPDGFSLLQNYPNPFNPSTTIKYYVPYASHVKIIIYDLLGRQIRTLFNDFVVAGIQSIEWDGTNSYGKRVSSGVYFYQLKAESGFTKTQKLVLLR